MWRIIEMEHEMSGLETSVKAKSGAFGNYIDPQRELFDAPQLSLVRAERVRDKSVIRRLLDHIRILEQLIAAQLPGTTIPTLDADIRIENP